MKLQQFIEKYSLLPMHFPSGWKPTMFLMEDEPQRNSFDDQYEFYSNADKTIWVSVNRTRHRFRICFCDLVSICSDWRNTEMDYELELIEAVPQQNA